MMKHLLILFIQSLSFAGYAQKTLMVEYVSTSTGLKTRVLLNDSFAFIYPYGNNGVDPLKKHTKEFGKKLVHHGYFYDFKKFKHYAVINFPKGYKYLIRQDSNYNYNWQFFNEKKIVAGYKCSAALSVSPSKDSTLLWYTKELPLFDNFEYYKGVHGIVLEIQSQGARDIHLIAKQVQVTDIQLFYPEEGEIISTEDFIKIQNTEKYKNKSSWFLKD